MRNPRRIKAAILGISAFLASCTSLESLIEACHANQGHAVIVVNPEVTEVRGVRCEAKY